jgi:hypothetical protein
MAEYTYIYNRTTIYPSYEKDISAIRRSKREYLNKMFLIFVVLRKVYKIKNKNYSNSYTVQKTSMVNSTFSMFLCLSTGLA